MSKLKFLRKLSGVAWTGAFLFLMQPALGEISPHPTKVTFLGISSFLVEGASESVLIDGFFSRTGLAPLKKIQPNATRIEKVLDYLCLQTISTWPNSKHLDLCGDKPRKTLNYVIPMHGHFDHALDSAYIAGRTGATLVTDQSGLRIQAATKRYFEDQEDHFVWDSKPEELSLAGPDDLKVVRFGDQYVTLFRTPHASNVVYPLFSRETEKNFNFRNRFWRLGEGTSLAAHINTGSGNMLIVASPKMPAKRLEDLKLKADVVFLSLGGLGLKSRDEIIRYFSSAVIKADAKRLYPIHWDKGKTALVPKPHSLIPMFPRSHKNVLNILSELSTTCGVQFNQIPIAIPFDPFADLPDKISAVVAAQCDLALNQTD